ncbi:MAG: hypothetical protein OXG80_07410 [Chloroflexi bacterium]|nr:hypothetical protein [Chloroflexota bacterium]
MTQGLLNEENSIPVIRVKEAGYENLSVDCPWCGCESVFNRVSDLLTTEPIGGLNTQCLNEKCGKSFRIVSDSANERHRVLVFDCHNLLARKQYMYCILNLATAYEMFFSLFLRVELLYRPFVADCSSNGLDEMNRLSEKLEGRIKRFTFAPLRRLFLQRLICQEPPANLDDAREAVCAIPKLAKCVKGVKNAKIRENRDEPLQSLLIQLNRSKIHELRNKIVHKRAYRPTFEESKDALDEARNIIFPLTSLLDIRDDLNWYPMRK